MPLSSGIYKAYSRANATVDNLLGRGGGEVVSVGTALTLATGSGALVSMVAQVILGRLMGPKQFGIYSLALTWFVTSLSFVMMGLDTTMVRLVAAYKALGDLAQLRGLLVRAVQFVAAAALIASAGFVFSSRYVSRELSSALLVGAPLVAVLGLLRMNHSILLALKQRVLASTVLGLLRQSIFLALILGVTWWLFALRTAQAALVLLLLASLAALVVSWFCVFRYLPSRLFHTAAQYRNREWFSMSLALMLVSVSQEAMFRSGVLFLGAFRSKAEVGIYAAAVTLASALDFFAISADAVVAPMFAELHARGKLAELQHTFTVATRAMFIATLPLGLILIFFGDRVLMLFGKKFGAAAPALAILAVGHVISEFMGPVGNGLAMTGEHSAFAKAVAGLGVAQVAFELVLIPSYGAIGAALAFSSSLAARSLLLGTLCASKVKVAPTVLGASLVRKLKLLSAAQ